ncbi:LolA family protein [Clostridium botulinum]|uniref:Uncharacterized protein TP-0789 domain-containing protein n=1 Tax=Clostridium botulinum TaxID=1491 RepID=A0A9Q1ZD97_CLOBO|nr:outer membrane lipoprotein-sorting protein [Clostridium botulinum]KEI02844.1 hypothetical protein Y848_06780 [Clostridium botulinum C/D str. Sp77]KEI03378.1 hypothetical protein Z953_05285 [Clostridium botulinum D str. 16868]KLU75140.1 hypothetical protein CBC3_10265 [Clostridium botulinum V891]KOA72881.1 hypothetical protein ADU77_14290 [Clostridium botulinum]KOA73313.1 hypothetical protein ADU78_12515 [Clostridium botulinum]
MVKKKLMLIMSVIVMSFSIFFTGCDSKSSIIPEDIITNVVNLNKEVKYFYGESKTENYKKDKKISTINIKEWSIPGNKVRREVINVGDSGKIDKAIMTCDGKKMIIYTKALDSYMESTNIAKDDFISRSPKKVAMDEIANITKTHTIEVKGEEEVNGRKTYHLYAKPKKGQENKSLFGDVNYWIDKENWFVVKSECVSGDMRTISEYTNVNLKLEINESIFTQKIPNGAKVHNLDDREKDENITLNEVNAKLGTNILIYNGIDYKLDKINYSKNNKEIGEEFNQIYTNNKGVALFSISMKKVAKKDKNDKNIKLPGIESTTVRGVSGEIMEMKSFKSISWQEDGINYAVFSSSVNCVLDDLKKVAEELVKSK